MNEISIKKEHIHAPFLILILFYCNFKQTVATLIFHTIILFQALTIPIDSSYIFRSVFLQSKIGSLTVFPFIIDNTTFSFSYDKGNQAIPLI